MAGTQFDQIQHLASRYIWWQTPDETMTKPAKLMAQIMNIGDYPDVQILVNVVGNEVLRAILATAQAGQFNQRSWNYWHYRLGLIDANEIVPSLPKRTFQ